MFEKEIEAVLDLVSGADGPALAPGPPLVHGALGVFPLLGERAEALDYITYDEATDGGAVAVLEVDEAGYVPQLAVENRGTKPVLIVDGEQLVGAKQNRVMNTTVLVPASSKAVIPVSCVEQGRWHYEGRVDMGCSPAPLYAGTRAAKSRQVSSSLEQGRDFASDQQVLWSDISSRLRGNNVFSPTESMEDHFRANRELLDAFHLELGYDRVRRDCEIPVVGAVFTVGGEVLGADVFDKARTLEQLWDKLLNSYAIEALGEKGSARAEERRATSFILEIAGAEMKAFPSPGAGADVRVSGRHIAGSALVVDSTVVHLCAFRVAGEGREADNGVGRMSGFKERRGRKMSL